MFTATAEIDYKNIVLFLQKPHTTYTNILGFLLFYIYMCVRKIYFTAVEESVMNYNSAYI